MRYSFSAYGHPNIRGTHKNTLEFTKDKEISLKGDCIIGIDSNFELSEIKKLLQFEKLAMTIEWPGGKEGIDFELNKDFNDNHELVIRKGDFASGRTFGTKAGKAAFELDRKLMHYLKDKKAKVAIFLES